VRHENLCSLICFSTHESAAEKKTSKKRAKQRGSSDGQLFSVRLARSSQRTFFTTNRERLRPLTISQSDSKHFEISFNNLGRGRSEKKTTRTASRRCSTKSSELLGFSISSTGTTSAPKLNPFVSSYKSFVLPFRESKTGFLRCATCARQQLQFDNRSRSARLDLPFKLRCFSLSSSF
jgi:hypothetical protein